jgi:hypothetical protein
MGGIRSIGETRVLDFFRVSDEVLTACSSHETREKLSAHSLLHRLC